MITMTAARYVADFDAFWKSFCTVPAPCSVSGVGYKVGSFADGAVLVVGDRIVEHVPFPVGQGYVDTLATVGRLLVSLTAESRAAQLAELGCKAGGTISLGGSVWNSDGSYVGLECNR